MKKALYISRYIFTMICLITQTAHQINAMRQTVYNRQIKTLQAVVNNDWLSPPVMILMTSALTNCLTSTIASLTASSIAKMTGPYRKRFLKVTFSTDSTTIL